MKWTLQHPDDSSRSIVPQRAKAGLRHVLPSQCLVGRLDLHGDHMRRYARQRDRREPSTATRFQDPPLLKRSAMGAVERWSILIRNLRSLAV